MKQMPAYFNVLKLRINRALKREVVLNFPIEAYIEPTSFCNLRCPACPTGLRLGERPFASIDETLFKSTIDQLGDYVFLLWMYNWGEPLLHKRTPELIRYAKSKELTVILSSNLSIRLSDDYIERLVKSGLDTMIVSLDGASAKTYEKYRLGGNFNLVRENMLRIQETKARLGISTPRVVWQFLVFEHNEHEVDMVSSLYKQWGADDIKIAPAEMPLEIYNPGLKPSTIPEYNMYHRDNSLVKETVKQMNGSRACSWLYGTFVLNPNGKVSACCGVSAEKNDFGDYQAGSDFFQVWNNEKFRRARSLFKTLDKRPTQAALNERQTQEIVKRIDGMAMGVNHSLDDSELICHQCPIPFRQADADLTILNIVYQLAHTFVHDSSPFKKFRCLIAYLLMGAPYSRKLLGEAVAKFSTVASRRLAPVSVK